MGVMEPRIVLDPLLTIDVELSSCAAVSMMLRLLGSPTYPRILAGKANRGLTRSWFYKIPDGDGESIYTFLSGSLPSLFASCLKPLGTSPMDSGLIE